MADAKHTPGPWDCDGRTIMYAAPHETDAITMIEVRANVTEAGWDTVAFIEAIWPGAEANARLIAASPKLFKAASAALERMAEVYRDTFDSRMDNDPLVIQLRAAITDAGPGQAGPEAERKPLDLAGSNIAHESGELLAFVERWLSAQPGKDYKGYIDDKVLAEEARQLVAKAHATHGLPSDIHEALAKRRQIAAIWSVEDVQEVRPDLSDDQAWEVLQHARQKHDAGIGITWSVLECHAEMLHGYAPEPPASGPADRPTPHPGSITAAILDDPKAFLPEQRQDGPDHGHGNDGGPTRGR